MFGAQPPRALTASSTARASPAPRLYVLLVPWIVLLTFFLFGCFRGLPCTSEFDCNRIDYRRLTTIVYPSHLHNNKQYCHQLAAMAVRSTAEEMERLQLSDDDTEDLWNSPSKRAAKKTLSPGFSDSNNTAGPQQPQDGGDTLFDREETREAALHNELHAVRNINEVIEGLLSSIDRAKGNMEVRRN